MAELELASDIPPSTDPTAQNLFPAPTAFEPAQYAGELEPEDLSWLCSTSLGAETQVFYQVLDDGRFLMLQTIFSGTGCVKHVVRLGRSPSYILFLFRLWFPTIQYTCNIYDPATGVKEWKSLSVNNFTAAPNGLDKRSTKADEFSVTHKTSSEPGVAESYSINVRFDRELQISLEVSRPSSAKGFKLGSGKKGGYSYLGANTESPDGYVIHRFWPYTTVKGFITKSGAATEISGRGMLVHAIQAMRPDTIATRWNFAYFSSKEHGGVSAILMEFKTCDTHGKGGSNTGGVVVGLGGVVVNGELQSVTGQTTWKGEDITAPTDIVARATHHDTCTDKTGYAVPKRLLFEWKGPKAGRGDPVSASLDIHVGFENEEKALVGG